MKKIVLTFVALLSLTAVMAQEKNCECKQNGKEMKAPREMTPQQRTERLAKRLNLTDAQKTQLQALNTEYADVLKGPGMPKGPRMHKGQRPQKPVDGETTATPQQRPERPQLTDAQKAEMKQQAEKRKEYESKLKKILTDDQYKEYQKMQPRHGHHGHGPRGPRPEKADKD